MSSTQVFLIIIAAVLIVCLMAFESFDRYMDRRESARNAEAWREYVNHGPLSQYERRATRPATDDVLAGYAFEFCGRANACNEPGCTSTHEGEVA